MIIKITQTASKQTNNDDCEKHIRLAAMIHKYYVIYYAWYPRWCSGCDALEASAIRPCPCVHMPSSVRSSRFSFVRISIISLVPSFHIFHIKSSLSTEFHLNELASSAGAVCNTFGWWNFYFVFFCHCFYSNTAILHSINCFGCEAIGE